MGSITKRTKLMWVNSDNHRLGIIKIFIISRCILFISPLSAQVNAKRFEKDMLINNGWNSPHEIIPTSDSGFCVNVNLRPPNQNYPALTRLNKYGDLIWSYSYGVLNNQCTEGFVKSTFDNGFIIAGSYRRAYYTPGDSTYICIIKIDSAGNCEWAKSNLSFGGRINSVIQLSDSCYALTYYYYNGGLSAVQKLDQNGNVMWTSKGLIFYVDIAEKSNGHLILMGGAQLKEFDENGNDVWEKKYSFNNWHFNSWKTDVNKYDEILLVSDLMNGGVDPQLYLLKTDPVGNVQFSFMYRYSANMATAQTYTGEFTKDCGIVVNGRLVYFNGTGFKYITAIFKCDLQGAVQWLKGYSSPTAIDAAWVASTSDFGYASLSQEPPGSWMATSKIIKTDINGETPCQNDSLINVMVTPIPLLIDSTMHFSQSISVSFSNIAITRLANNVTFTDYCSDSLQFDSLVDCYACTTAIPEITGPDTVCSGDSSILSVPGFNYTYLWSPGGQTTSSIIVCPDSITTYTVTVTNLCGTGSNSKTIVLFPPAPIPIITAQDSVCIGNNVLLAASGGLSYQWNNGAITDSIQDLITATTIYTVTLTDINGCRASNNDTVCAIDLPLLTTIITPSNCENVNGSVLVNVVNGFPPYQYSWNCGQTTQTATGLSAGIYVVTVTNSMGCTQTTTDTVNISLPPVLSITSQNNPLCYGDTNGMVSVGVNGGIPPYNFNWNTSIVQNSQTAMNLAAGTYTVTVIDSIGCSQTLDVTINQPDSLNITLYSERTCGLNNGFATVASSGGTGKITYLWYPGGSTDSIASGLSSGLYTCIATDSNGCNQSQTINVLTDSIPTANAGENMNIIAGDTVMLIGNGGIIYNWSPETGLSCTDCQNPVANPLSTISYTLTVTNEAGCTSTAIVVINVTCGDVYIPMAFSPNGDLLNDFECIYATCLQSFIFAIYDRWGELIFETRDQSYCWDGSYKGTIINGEVFVYCFNGVLLSGETINKKGIILLLR
jgi:gliding motility-associated-like protein